MNGVFESNHHAIRWIVQFIINLVISAINYSCVLERPEGSEKEETQNANANKNGKYESSSRFIDMGFSLELEVDKQVAEKHANEKKIDKRIAPKRKLIN